MTDNTKDPVVVVDYVKLEDMYGSMQSEILPLLPQYLQVHASDNLQTVVPDMGWLQTIAGKIEGLAEQEDPLLAPAVTFMAESVNRVSQFVQAYWATVSLADLAGEVMDDLLYHKVHERLKQRDFADVERQRHTFHDCLLHLFGIQQLPFESGEGRSILNARCLNQGNQCFSVVWPWDGLLVGALQKVQISGSQRWMLTINGIHWQEKRDTQGNAYMVPKRAVAGIPTSARPGNLKALTFSDRHAAITAAQYVLHDFV